MKVRVRDFYFDESDQPITDSETGRPLRNNIPYFYAGQSYYPGEVIEMPDDVARAAMKQWNPNRPRPLEPASAHEERQQRIEQRAATARDEERHAIRREMHKLDQQSEAVLRMRRLAHKKELAELSAQPPGAMTAHALRLLQQQTEEEEQRQRASDQVREDALSEVAQARADAEEARAEADRLRRELEEARAEARARGQEGVTPAPAAPATGRRSGRGGG